jgi:hypothetical protein
MVNTVCIDADHKFNCKLALSAYACVTLGFLNNLIVLSSCKSIQLRIV